MPDNLNGGCSGDLPCVVSCFVMLNVWRRKFIFLLKISTLLAKKFHFTVIHNCKHFFKLTFKEIFINFHTQFRN